MIEKQMFEYRVTNLERKSHCVKYRNSTTFWCENFVESHSVRRVLEDSPNNLPKLGFNISSTPGN